MAMEMTSRALVNTVLLVLLLVFGGIVTQSLFHFMDGKVARSTKDMFDRYVKFPTISICIGGGDGIGFDDMGLRPMNDTLDYFGFTRHFMNG